MTRNEQDDTVGGLDGGDAPLVTRPRNDIVVGIDDSPSAAAALLWAVEQAKETGTALRVVHAWHLSAAASAALAAGAGDYLEAAGADARARATRIVIDVLGGGAAEVRWTLDVAEGGAGPVLVDRSRDARVLVIGTREHTGLRRAVSGSVSHYCLAHAQVPVVAVPNPDDAHYPDTDRRQMASPTPLL
jgi:nucleotide-binding universal stress UspA family protein